MLRFYLNYVNVAWNSLYERTSRRVETLSYLIDLRLRDVFRNLDKSQTVLLTHGDCIERVADTFRTVATSRNFIVGIANDKLRLYGLQFHPEVKEIKKIVWILRYYIIIKNSSSEQVI